MEKKVSIYIFVPEYRKKINCLVPQTMDSETIVRLVCRLLNKIQLPIEPHTAKRLISEKDGLLLPLNKSIYECGICDGDELILYGGKNG